MVNQKTHNETSDVSSKENARQTGAGPAVQPTPKPQEPSRPAPPPTSTPPASQKASWRWWALLLVRPAVFFAAGLLLLVALGVLQKLGWFTAPGPGAAGSPEQQSSEQDQAKTMYVCPMNHIPPQPKPGRCPVCGMELVPVRSETDQTDGRWIQIEPAARRVAGIRTVPVQAKPLVRKIRTIGLLSTNEEMEKTIAAYVDGRIERLYANYTGMVVQKGDPLVRLYSPQLYVAQVELLLAKQQKGTAPSGLADPRDSGVYMASRVRLAEWGMTPEQIDAIERLGRPTSRMDIVAPISGTIIEKLAVEGQYVHTGQPIYRLADLSTVWLRLQLFPEEASLVRYGQQVEAQVQSLPGKRWKGRVAFIQPTVDPQTRTVDVRVVIENRQGQLRIGDYATATISVELDPQGQPLAEVYDAELAGQWISPRHPQVIRSSPGKCPVCGVDLVPASKFGFSDKPVPRQPGLVVPRSAVLTVGQDSVVYVETKPGRFELRPVVLGPTMGEEIAILEGLQEGELVAYAGNFLIDSQTQLAGKPSLIDPRKAQPSSKAAASAHREKVPPKPPKAQHTHQASSSAQPTQPHPPSSSDKQPAPANELAEALAELPPEDRLLAEQQKICPVSGQPLGSMGKPVKLIVRNRTVFLCCEGCRDILLADPDKYLARLKKEHDHDR